MNSSSDLLSLLPSLYTSTHHSSVSGLCLYKLFYESCSDASDTKELTAFFKNYVILVSGILNKVSPRKSVFLQSVNELKSVHDYVAKWEELNLFSKRLAWISDYYTKMMNAEHDQKLIYFELRCVKLPTLVEVINSE